MEVLSPSSPPVFLPISSSSSSSSSPSMALSAASSALKANPPPRGSGDPPVVHVAVGRSLQKGKDLILWTLRRFGCNEVVLVHVHKPSPTIPTMMGQIPARKASDKVVSLHRKEEWKQMKRDLCFYSDYCRKAKDCNRGSRTQLVAPVPSFSSDGAISCCGRMDNRCSRTYDLGTSNANSQGFNEMIDGVFGVCIEKGKEVKATFMLNENEDVAEGLLRLISRHTILRLVMGTKLDNCMNVKKGFNKEFVTAKNAPPFCEIWFIKKGKHVWTRDPTEDPSSLEIVPKGIEVSSQSSAGASPKLERDLPFEQENGYATSSSGNRIADESDDQRDALSDEVVMDDFSRAYNVSASVANTLPSSLITSGEGTSHHTNLKDKDGSCTLQDSPVKERTRDQTICEEAFEESLNYEELEREKNEAVNKANSLKSEIRFERMIRRELRKILKNIRRQQKELIEERDEAAAELAKTTEAIAVLETSVQKAEELKFIQDSILSLKIERYKIRRLIKEAESSLLNAETEDCEKFVGISEDFLEFDLSDLQNATCNFSENFKIGQGGNGCIYKGELLNRTVAIKKLYPNCVQLEFEQEACILGNLRHPHLVPSIGICPEALSLVSEYMPNGNLNDRLSRSSHSTTCWTWQERTRTASEIASAILFLHCSEPDAIIHGDLKPENIFFNSDFSCKIGDFGIGRLVQEDSMHCPSFRRNSESTSPFSYSDPEYQRTGKLTTKSDIYSFGVIILQLLTGRPPAGLASEVRRAMLEGKLASVLDPSAGGWPLSVATRLAEFSLQCCEKNARDRPELTDMVVRELQRLHIMEEQPVLHFFMCPILQEIMHDPHVAADGYTYEGKAFRNWIENGHDTSPMTNLKLDNLDLTPNRALRIAIQEWLSQSRVETLKQA